MKALLWEPLEDKAVQCRLCGHRCVIQSGRRGICGVRCNEAGELETLVYGRLIARHVDPVEKKPIFHMLPGHLSYSIATVGCNFRCRFCQNADIAHMPANRDGLILGDSVTPDQVVRAALDRGCRSIAYTYTEPTVFFEFAFDTARMARKEGLKNIFVTNGYMSPEALEMVAPYMDAANVDLKAFSDSFYKELCGARRQHVMATLNAMKRAGVLVEVTTLVIPGLNDDTSELMELAQFLADELGPETPWHISRFHPTYRLTERPPTPVETLVRAREIGLRAGLRYVYTGNVPGEASENTYCHGCEEVLVKRWGFSVRDNRIVNGHCPDCQTPIDGVWA